MNLNDHRFSKLEKKYYDFYLKNRKQASKPFADKIFVNSNLIGHLHLLKANGYVQIPPESLKIEDDLAAIQKQIYNYYSKNNTRVLQNPFGIVGLYELVKKALAPIACCYYKCVPTISYIKVIKSYTSSDPKDTQFFHRDPGSYKLLKAVIYLNDVGASGGPLVYVQNSNKENLNGISGRERMGDNMVKQKYKSKIKELIGPAGQVTFFDAKGIHKGKLPTKNDRVAIIVNFSLHSEYGQKDNYSKITYNMTDSHDGFDLMLLDSCVPVFGVKDEDES
jgi:hypothetical protein